jgi:hypothetical protein
VALGGGGLAGVGYCSRCESPGRNVRHRQHSLVGSFPSSVTPSHSLASSSRRMEWFVGLGNLAIGRVVVFVGRWM